MKSLVKSVLIFINISAEDLIDNIRDDFHRSRFMIFHGQYINHGRGRWNWSGDRSAFLHRDRRRREVLACAAISFRYTELSPNFRFVFSFLPLTLQRGDQLGVILLILDHTPTVNRSPCPSRPTVVQIRKSRLMLNNFPSTCSS